MSRYLTTALALVLSAAAIGLPGAAQKPKAGPAASAAKSFIDGIYRDYERTGRPLADQRVFAPELAALIAKDDEIAKRQREPNLIDYDLLCQCQDNGGLRFATSIIASSPTSAMARVSTTFNGKPARIEPFNLQLSKTAVGWRVADIVTSGKYGGSLLIRLRKGLPSTGAATSAAANAPVRSQPVAMPAMPPSIRYQGYTGSDRYPVYNDLRMTMSDGTLTGTLSTVLGIFSGTASITGNFRNGECIVIRKKDTFQGPCDRNQFTGTLYDSKGKPLNQFVFLSEDELLRRKANRSGQASPPQAVVATYVASPPIVWSLGRARYLVERGRRCGPEASLGTSYCFGEVIEALQRHPEKNSIDAVAMETSWALGSMIPHNNGQGWDIYKVSRQGNGFAASKQRHYGTQIRLPQGCMYSGVAEQAWFITVARGRKTAVEAARYLCDGWRAAPVYARYLDMGDLDAGAGDVALSLMPTQGAAQGGGQTSTGVATYPATSNQSAWAADGGGPPLRENWLSGTSAAIFGEPRGDSTPVTKRKHK